MASSNIGKPGDQPAIEPGEKAQQLAKRVAEEMWRHDAASRGLGMALGWVEVGRAELSMPVRADMVNGHDICHGGFIFALADSAFAFACNSYNKVSLAQACDISFVAPARLGDRLIARAEERHLAGRSGIYDVTVYTESGTMIALMRGKSRTIRGETVSSGQPNTDAVR